MCTVKNEFKKAWNKKVSYDYFIAKKVRISSEINVYTEKNEFKKAWNKKVSYDYSIAKKVENQLEVKKRYYIIFMF